MQMQTTDSRDDLQARITNDEVCGQLHTFRRVLYARALGLERSSADAHDLVQETFERAIRHRRRFIVGTNLLGWLTTIMRNVFTDRVRHRQVRRRALVEVHASMTPAPGDGDDGDGGARPFDLLTQRDVVAALADLPSIYRRPFKLFHLEGLNQRAIGSLLGIPVATVGTRLYRARLMMREVLLNRHGARLGVVGVSSSVPAAPLRLPPAAAPFVLVRPQQDAAPVFRPRLPAAAPRSGPRGPRRYAEPAVAFARLPGTC